MTAATTAERQRAYKARQQEAGLTEVRGIYARPEDHAAIKEYAVKLSKKRRKAHFVST